jgi:hypothetical protein
MDSIIMAYVNTNTKEPKQLIRFIPRFYDWGMHGHLVGKQEKTTTLFV